MTDRGHNCAVCIHLIRGSAPPRCEAFPKGIPLAIQTGVRHDVPYPGDNGIRFDLAPLWWRLGFDSKAAMERRLGKTHPEGKT